MEVPDMTTPTVERALDVDSHEMVPVDLRESIFGHTALNDVIATLAHKHVNNPNATKAVVTGDDTPINHDTVWNLKGASAPSAIDLDRRPDVLELMGIERQLVFPTFGLAAIIMAMDPFAHQFLGFEPGT